MRIHALVGRLLGNRHLYSAGESVYRTCCSCPASHAETKWVLYRKVPTIFQLLVPKIAFVISSLWIVEASNITDGKNKIKRNLSGDIQNYGESNIVWLSSEKHPSVIRNANTYFSNNVRPIALVGVHSPLKVYEPKVNGDQVQYEFEPSPTNPASNLHLKQLFQPANNFNQELAGQTYKPVLQNNSPNDATPNNFNQELAGQTYKSLLYNAPNVASSNNFNQELSGQTYKPFLQNNGPNVVTANNFNQELTGQTYKPFLQINAPNVVRANNYNQEAIGQTYRPFLQSNAPNNVVGSETIVTPVQHSHLIQNNIHPVHPYNNVRVHPLYNVQPQYIGPKKYIYLNGKIIYDPNTFHNQNAPTFYHSSQQFPQRQPIINHVNNNGVPRQNLVPPLVNQPIPQNRFQPPSQSQMLPIDTPSTAPPKTERQQKHSRQKAEEKPVEEDKDEEDNEEYRQHEDDSDNYEGSKHGKYSFEDEDEDDHHSFKEHEDIEEDDEEDSNGGSTRYISSKVNKYPKKFNKPGKRDEIIYGSRYEYPEKKHSKDSGKKRSMKFKSYKFSKDSDQYPREGIEGRQSQYVPVTHKQKIFKEKWYLSKSSADREQFDE